MKRLIWGNIEIDLNDWREDYIEEAEINGWDEDTDDDENLWRFIYETLDSHIEDERDNLDVRVDGRILCIGDIGLWHGRVPGYRIFDNNISSILNADGDYIEWYGDGHNIRGTSVHHDGRNEYEYRIIREDRNIENLLSDIYNGKEISRQRLNYYTKSLYPAVAAVYGWR